VTGETALILPCLGRSEADHQASGEQFVSVENSMGIVHQSQGRLSPASDHLLSEVGIVCRLAQATLNGKYHTPWNDFEQNYDLIRDRIERVIPGFDNYNKRVRQPGGFYLPNGVKERKFKTKSGKAEITVNPLEPLHLEPGQLLLQTFRSHDQFNTTVYGLNDRYRGIKNERRVIFLHPADMQERGLQPEQPLAITRHFEGATRTAERSLAIPYDTPRGCAAAYYPEANVLVPIRSKARLSETPASKSVIVTVKARS